MSPEPAGEQRAGSRNGIKGGWERERERERKYCVTLTPEKERNVIKKTNLNEWHFYISSPSRILLGA
jgi:hypothetical protein